MLQPRVTPSLPVGAEGSLFQRIFSSQQRHRSLCVGRVRRLSGPVRRRLLLRQGHLRHRRLRGGAARPRARQHDAEPRSLRGHLRPLRARLRHRGGRGVSRPLRRGRGAPASLGARRLAASALDAGPGEGTGRHGARASCPPSASGRCSTICGARCRRRPPIVALLAGWTLPLPAALALDGLRAAGHRPARRSCRSSPRLLPRHAGITAAQPSRRARHAISRRRCAQTALLVAFLAHQAWLMIDAIGRTLFRLFVSQRRLLEWITAAQSKQQPARRLARPLSSRWPEASWSALAAAARSSGCAGRGRAAGRRPVRAGLAARAGDRALGEPAARATPAASRCRRPTPASLRLIARRTWRFFETFVTETTTCCRRTISRRIRSRSSPSGRRRPISASMLLSTVAARDFGWIGTLETVERLEATLATMERLKRFRGHFFNWYDTSDLRPLEPPYVSTVDSGNLAGHLIALANACAAWRGEPPRIPTARRRRRPTAWRSPARRCARCPTTGARISSSARARVWRSTRWRRPCRDALLRARRGCTATAARTARRPRPHARQRARRSTPAPTCCSGSRRRTASIESRRRDLAQTGGRRGQRSQSPAADDRGDGARHGQRHGVRLPARSSDRRLLSIGYLVAEDRLDPNCYDLLASEARLASFVAIAKGDIPARHWFRLGPRGDAGRARRGAGLVVGLDVRVPHAVAGHARAVRQPAREDQPSSIVQRQIDYAARPRPALGHLRIGLQRARPGIHLPVLELRRARPRLQARPERERRHRALCHGARRHGRSRGGRGQLRRAGGASAGAAATASTRRSTSRRRGCPTARPQAIVRAYMAHHQGMTIVAIANALLDGIMRARFHAEPMVQATELLLQERTPRDVAVAHPRAEEVGAGAAGRAISKPPIVRRLRNPHAASPSVHLLSNGRYSVMLTAAGSGYSRWDDQRRHALARGHDARRLGQLHLPARRRERRGVVGRPTSRAARGPTATTSCSPRIAPSSCATTATLTTTPRRRRLARGRRRGAARVDRQCRRRSARDIEVTSYAEIVLAPPAADAAHQAFSKLFVQTEYLAGCRRPPGDTPPPRPGRARALGRPSRGRRGRGGRRASSSRPIAPASSAAATRSATPSP